MSSKSLNSLSNTAFLVENLSPTLSAPVSQLVTKQQCDSSEFKYWVNEMQLDINKRWLEKDQHYNRKIWEWAYILQVLKINNLLQNDIRGLGFGVGREPLVATMAKFGCSILATDLPSEDAVRNGWDNLGQYSFDINDLNEYGICDESVFAERATYRNVNMNHIDEDLVGFDFVYSSCALEHLGSLEKGIAFIKKDLQKNLWVRK
ncbi:MAG: hypothetical protein WBO18_10475 [Gammaproteobacteria bacterium]